MRRARKTRNSALAISIFAGVLATSPLGGAPAPSFAIASTATQAARSNSPREHLSFDAASIKRSDNSGDGRARANYAGNRVAMSNFTLRQLMAAAYNLPSLSQAVNTIIAMPGWGTSQRFDIEAEAPGNPSIEQKRSMLQTLLAQRFKLTIHNETRQMPGYALTLLKAGKLGSQLHVHTNDQACEEVEAAPDTAPSTTASASGTEAHTQSEAAERALARFPCGREVGGLLAANDKDMVWAGARKVSMEMLAASIGTMDYTDRPVIDRTGLTGTYDFTVEWNTKLNAVSVGAQPEDAGVSLFEAIRDQLGLKLQPTKGPVEVIVIDHVEEPSPN